MKISINERMDIEAICHTFFGNKEIVSCIKGEYTPKSWFWQKHFKIKEHGVFLAWLLFNGVFKKESENIVFDFLVKYKGRIVDGMKVRKCVGNRIEKYGFEIGILYTILTSFTSKQLFIKHEPKCCGLFMSIIPDFRFGVNVSLKCAYLNEVLDIYSELENEIPYTIQDNDISTLLKLIINGDVYGVVLPFVDKIVVTSLLRICISQWKIPSTIEKVRGVLYRYLENSYLQHSTINTIKKKFDEGAKIILDNYTLFKTQESRDKCLEVLKKL